MKRLLLFCLIILFPAKAELIAQVGIGTNTPASGVMLDVNGNVRIRDLSAPAKSITGLTASGLLRTTELGAGLISGSTSDEIRTTASILSLGAFNLDTISSTAGVYNDLDLGLDGVNEDIVFFTLYSSGGNKTITGIKGGTHGRRIILYNKNSSSSSMELKEVSSSSQNSNRIYTLGQGQGLATNGDGMFELIYDANAASGVGRWVIIKHNP